MANTSTIELAAESGRGDGLEACPFCKGLGYLRRDVPISHPDFGKLVPCSCQLERLASVQLGRLDQLPREADGNHASTEEGH